MTTLMELANEYAMAIHNYGCSIEDRASVAAKRLNEARAQLAAAFDLVEKDAALWRAYKARKDAVIAAGMAKNAMRDEPCFGDERYYAND